MDISIGFRAWVKPNESSNNLKINMPDDDMVVLSNRLGVVVRRYAQYIVCTYEGGLITRSIYRIRLINRFSVLSST